MAILKKMTGIEFNNESELNQLEKAFLAAGYEWYIPDARRQALERSNLELLTCGTVCPGYTSLKFMPFHEGLALLESLAEPEAEPEPSGTGDSIAASVASSGWDWTSVSAILAKELKLEYGPFTTCDNPLSVSLKDDSISSKETSMSETKPETTIERRIALATGGSSGVLHGLFASYFAVLRRGAVNMFYAALFGGVCYGGYELVQFLQSIKITLPE